MKGAARMSIVAGLLAGLLASCYARASDAPVEPGATDGARSARIDLEETVISGNQELPKVLYIVPWQAPGARPELTAPAVAGNDGLFRRLQPAAHRRELFYLDNLPGIAPKE